MVFVKIDKLLNKSIKKANISDKVEAVNILDEFEKCLVKIFDKDIRVKIKPLYFKNGNIKVSVTSSILASEIKQNEKEIIDLLNSQLKSNPVKKIFTSL